MNGFAAEIKVANLHQIKNIKGVKNLYYDRVYSAPEVEREELNPQMLTSDKMIGIREAWAIENGISDGTNPKGTATRGQMATILARLVY